MRKCYQKLIKEIDETLDSLLVDFKMEKMDHRENGMIALIGLSVFHMAKDDKFRSDLYHAAADLKFRKEQEKLADK